MAEPVIEQLELQAAASPPAGAPDFWNLIAVEKFGCPPGWQWLELKAIGDDLPREKCISMVRGAVCREAFKSGPRKGKRNIAKRDRSTERTFYVTFGDFDAFCLEWERREGRCHSCGGAGRMPWRVSVTTGVEYEVCRRCKGDGKALPHG